MTLPSDEELAELYDQVFFSFEVPGVKSRQAGIAAVKREIIEALARDADDLHAANGDPDSPWFSLDMYGNEIAGWLRSHTPD